MNGSELPQADENPWEIRPAPAAAQRKALALVYGSLDPADRQDQLQATLAGQAAGRISLAGLLQAEQNGATYGAVWVQELPGKTALFWPPQVVAGAPPHLKNSLQTAADEYLAAQGIELAQGVLPPGSTADAQWLLAHGFIHAAEMLYLHASQLQADGAFSPHLNFIPLQHASQQRLTGVLEDTYRQTLDCPLLNGVRNLEDVIAGYAATGDSGTACWYLIEKDQQDIGCLLLARHGSQSLWELVYMGIAPFVRGQGLGREIVRTALRLAAAGGGTQMMLGVDAANTPAIAMYQQCGFEEWGRRSVFLRGRGLHSANAT